MDLVQNECEEENDEDTDSEEENEKEEKAPTTVIHICIFNKKTKQEEVFKVLLDTGANNCMGTNLAIARAGLKTTQDKKIRTYNTAAGLFTTTKKACLKSHKILELNSRRTLQKLQVRVTETKLGDYDFIFGRQYLRRYGIDLLFSDKTIRWDGMIMPMKEWSNEPIPETDEAEETPETDEAEEEIIHPALHLLNAEDHYAQQIEDSKYERQDLKKISLKQTHLSLEQRKLLYNVLSRHPDLFNGTLGRWKGDPIHLDLVSDAKPYHCQKPMRVPHIHMETLKKEIYRLVEAGVLEEVDPLRAPAWCAPTFIIPKKDNRVRVITDYRELNKRIKRKPWPMPHITDMLQDIGNYTYVTAIDLSMGFYHFSLDKEAQDMSTFMVPFGLFKFIRLPMGLSVSPDIFQGAMAKLFVDCPNIKVYMDDLLIFSHGSFEDHMEKVSEVLDRLSKQGMAVNAEKSYWAVQEVDYLGFRLTREGVKPQIKKVEAIRKLKAPKNKKELRRFIGMVNYYRLMWRKRSDILTPLTTLTKKSAVFRWTNEHQKAFEEMKQTICKEVLLSFPDFSQPFEIYTDASDRQLGAVLMQGNKTLAFYSKKLLPAQLNYGVGEKEMLSIVETLKEFKTMIFGYPVHVYTDHKNWTHDKNIRNQRVARWRMTLEEFAPTFHYIEGKKNIVADLLSRHPTSKDELSKAEEDMVLEEMFEIPQWRQYLQPITVATIQKEQRKDQTIKQMQVQMPDRLGELSEDIGKPSGPDKVITVKDIIEGGSKMMVPKSLQQRLIHWYHVKLLHPGANRLYNTIRQHYIWPKMLSQIRDQVKHCEACQKAKRGLRGYGKIPLKDPETTPWKDVALDLSGPWKVTIDNKETAFWSLTLIDVFTGWVEIIPITTKEQHCIRDLVEQEWLRRYPRPSRFIFDSGGEFDNEAFRALCLTWYINPVPITIKNPRANAIVERMHRVLGDMLRIQLTQRHKNDNPLRDMLSAAAYGIRATVHGVTRYSPSQLVYGKDMILRTDVEASIHLARQRREVAIEQNNARENRRRIAHNYIQGDKVLILSGGMDPKLQLHEGPYKVLSYDKATGTLRIQRKNYIEPINVRRVRPYFDKRKVGK